MDLGTDVYQFERTQAWTIGFYIQPVDFPSGSGRHIFSEYQSSGIFRGRLIRIDTSGVLRFWLISTFGSNELKVNYAPPQLGKLTPVIISYDGSSTAAGVKCWYDGVLQPQSSATETLSATIVATGVSTMWGGWAGVNLSWKGNLSECFIDTRAWVQADVDDYIYDHEFSLGTPTDVWRMTEGSGTSVASTGTGAHNATLGAGITWVTSPTPGKSRTAIPQTRLSVS